MKKIRKRKCKIIFIAILIELILNYVYFASTKLILDAGGEIFKANISNCSYYAIEKCIEEDFDFDKICQIEKDADGNVTFIKSDTLLLNYVVKKLSLDCYDFMDEYVQKGFDIPLGAFSGIKLLAGFGPLINVKLATALSVECKIVRNFTSAGINQTRQTFSAIIYTEITVFAPFYKEHYDGNIEIVLFDNLIVDKVPETYLNASVIASGSTSN